MRNAILTSITAAVSAGLALGVAHASANPLTFRSTASMTGGEDDSRDRATSALEGMLTRFIKVDKESAASSGAHSGNDKCPDKQEETQVTDAGDDKEADKNAPQGPEPIYFAF